MLPKAIRIMVTPSVLQKNFSPRSRGERIADIIMVKQDVEAISIMFPYLIAPE